MEIVKNEQPTEIFKKIPIEDTPFLIIWDEENKRAFGTFGQYRITEEHDNPEAVKEELTKITWDKLVTVIALINEMFKNQTNTDKL